MRRSILSVEDDDAAHHLLEIAIRETGAGFRVYRVKDGIEALRFLAKAEPFKDVPTPDLVLSDLNMPRMGGLDLLREMQKEDVLRKIPVVVISSSRSKSDSDQSLALGAKHFISKSPNYAEFVADIKVACGYIDGDALAASTL